MTDKIEDAIKEIALKHNIAVSRDDPILILQTMNDRLIEESRNSQKKILATFESELEEIAHRWGENARDKAERTLNAAITASKASIDTTMKESSTLIAEAVKREIKGILNQNIKPSVRETQQVAILNLIAASMTLFAAGLVLWTTL